MIQCPICQRSISPNAKACPACGEPIQARNESARKSNFAGQIIIVVILVVVALLMLLGAIRQISG